MVKIRNQKKDEDRRDYMLKVAAGYIRDVWPDGEIFYDESTCDGYCVADDCESAGTGVRCIIIERREHDYKAINECNPKQFGLGKTQDAAIGCLIIGYPEIFNITIKVR